MRSGYYSNFTKAIQFTKEAAEFTGIYKLKILRRAVEKLPRCFGSTTPSPPGRSQLLTPQLLTQTTMLDSVPFNPPKSDPPDSMGVSGPARLCQRPRPPSSGPPPACGRTWRRPCDKPRAAVRNPRFGKGPGLGQQNQAFYLDAGRKRGTTTQGSRV